MSVFLLGSSLVTTMLIEPSALRGDGAAVDRALAYLAHGGAAQPLCPLFGEAFGGMYDLSTVAILWFAGASAMSGLLNLVPRYLPRYGMAPQWATAFRPLVMFFIAVSILVTWLFDANVSAQGGAYATGVMVLMLSAAIAVVTEKFKDLRHGGWAWGVVGYGLIAAIFLYTTVAIVVEKPDGIKIASAFIVVILLTSIASRVVRSKELRFERFVFKSNTAHILWDTLQHLDIPVLVPHRPGVHQIANKERRIRRVHRLPENIPLVFVEATLGDTSEFIESPLMDVVQEEGRFIVRVQNCVSIPHAIATVALELSKMGGPLEVHCDWSERSPMAASLSFVLFGEGNVPWIVRDLIQTSKSDEQRRPRVIIG